MGRWRNKLKTNKSKILNGGKMSMNESEIIKAIDVVCINCVEDTLEDENKCDNCPVRKLAMKIEEKID
jgi:hypothetical protein